MEKSFRLLGDKNLQEKNILPKQCSTAEKIVILESKIEKEKLQNALKQ